MPDRQDLPASGKLPDGPVAEQQIVIVGTGQAGLSAAEKLRTHGFKGRIVLVGEEPHAPYQRPPLSKSYLLGKLEGERLKLKADDWYAANQIHLRAASRVEEIDREQRRIALSDGTELSYDRLVLATGATARQLPEALARGLSGLFTMRTLADVDRLRQSFNKGSGLLVIGGGYIGLEIAAAACGCGISVDLVEAAPRLLMRVACAETAREIEALHRSKGVRFHLGKTVDTLLGSGSVAGARLGDGTTIDAGIVVAGIGGMPDTALALRAGLQVDNGIVVDAFGRTADPCVWAAGDCANFILPDGPMRMESVGNAIDSADLVARNIMGAMQLYRPKPWFWSDQFDLKLQIAGLSRPDDAVVVRKGTAAGRSHWYYRAGRLVAVDGLNAPRDYLIGKRFLAMAISPEPALVADSGGALEALASPSR